MNCRKAERQIDRYYEEGLSREEEAALREHLDLCRDCNRIVAGLAALDRDLGAVFDGPGPSPELAHNIAVAVATLSPGGGRSVRLLRLMPAIAAGLLIGIAALALLRLGGRPPTAGPATPIDEMLATFREFEPADGPGDGLGRPFVIDGDAVDAYHGGSPVRVIRPPGGAPVFVVDAFPARVREEG